MNEAPVQVSSVPLPCLRCGYDLRGSVADPQGICPECGSPFDLRPPDDATVRFEALVQRVTRAALGCGVAVFFLLGGTIMFFISISSFPVVVVTYLIAGPALCVEWASLGKLLGTRQGWRKSALLTAVAGAAAFAFTVTGLFLAFSAVLSFLGAVTVARDPLLAAALCVLCFVLGVGLVTIGPWFGYWSGGRLMRRAILGATDLDDWKNRTRESADAAATPAEPASAHNRINKQP